MSKKIKSKFLKGKTALKSRFGSGKVGARSEAVDALRELDISSVLLEALQSDAARNCYLAVEQLDEDGEVTSREYTLLEAKRSTDSVEELLSALSPFAAAGLFACLSLQAVQREAIQGYIVLKMIDHLRDNLGKNERLVYQSRKYHRLIPWGKKTIIITPEDIDLAELVATANVARYEHTMESLVTRARSKQAKSKASFKMGGVEMS